MGMSTLPVKPRARTGPPGTADEGDRAGLSPAAPRSEFLKSCWQLEGGFRDCGSGEAAVGCGSRYPINAALRGARSPGSKRRGIANLGFARVTRSVWEREVGHVDPRTCGPTRKCRAARDRRSRTAASNRLSPGGECLYQRHQRRPQRQWQRQPGPKLRRQPPHGPRCHPYPHPPATVVTSDGCATLAPNVVVSARASGDASAITSPMPAAIKAVFFIGSPFYLRIHPRGQDTALPLQKQWTVDHTPHIPLRLRRPIPQREDDIRFCGCRRPNAAAPVAVAGGR